MQFVCGSTLVFIEKCWWIHTGRGSSNCCLTCRSVLYMHEGWSFFFYCSVLAKGPSNWSVMTRKTMLFGTVVERDNFFKGLPRADDSAGYYEVLEKYSYLLLFIFTNYPAFQPYFFFMMLMREDCKTAVEMLASSALFFWELLLYF